MDKRKSILLVILLIISIYIFGMIYNTIQNGIDLNKLNNIYKDIDILEERILIYYLDNGKLPIIGEKLNFNHGINPNDNGIFYEIDLSKLENLYLNYGNKKTKDDVYIINEQSHTIYYMQGVNYNNEKYYTRKLNYEKINLEEYK